MRQPSSMGRQGWMRVIGDIVDHGVGDGPPFVVPPGAVDEQQLGRETLIAETMPLDQLQGGVVVRSDLGFQPVEPQLLEGMAQYKAEAFGHVSLAGGGSE